MKEVIVVEGKNDYHAVKRAEPKAEIITTSGFGISAETMARIKRAYKKRGVIILMDPDHVGEIIRKKLAAQFPKAKHAFVSREKAIENDDIGIENAQPGEIKRALSKVRTTGSQIEQEFNMDDLLFAKLTISSKSAKRRAKLGALLGIGYGNSKTFLKRLNQFDVTREEFNEGLKKLDGEQNV
ncbi:ribonuclease M5 [Proteinivorax hydrogeniformans]|uniref:Ribonuclease M5 n=1 Tax=Proteinivorax hydrogeniformans TaxID=1826727 RepID=A0AAU8HTX4_9FIRM